MRNVPGLEAVYRDYAEKKVKFYFVYKALAHPERNGILQPITLQERMLQAQEAPKQLGNTIPFLVDAIDNRLKHALGDRNNSEFIVDPNGKIVRKRTWSNQELVRKDLEELVGKSSKFTKAEDLKLKVDPPSKAIAAKGVTPRVSRTGMNALLIEPQIAKDSSLFYVKLRAEADSGVMDDGKGKLYLGFHLDPFYKAHWNNLKKQLRFEIESSTGVRLSVKTAEAVRPNVPEDIDPREFLIDVNEWTKDVTIRVNVSYAACTEDVCHELTQSYVIHRQRDRDGGRAVSGNGQRARTAEEMIKRLMEGDKNADGKLTSEELQTSLRSRFAEFDLNRDGVLDKEEIAKMAAKLVEQRKP